MRDDVKEIIFNIVKQYNYLSIILFGSRARNEQREDSDYDLLIILKNDMSIVELRRIQLNVRKELAMQNIDADVIVRTQKLVNQYKDRQGNIIYEAMREGVKL